MDLAEILPCIGAGARITLPPKRLADGLVAEADAEERDRLGRPSRSVEADAGLVRRAGPGESTMASGFAEITWPTLILSLRCTTVSRAEVAEEVVEVVGEAVVVIDAG